MHSETHLIYPRLTSEPEYLNNPGGGSETGQKGKGLNTPSGVVYETGTGTVRNAGL